MSLDQSYSSCSSTLIWSSDQMSWVSSRPEYCRSDELAQELATICNAPKDGVVELCHKIVDASKLLNENKLHLIYSQAARDNLKKQLESAEAEIFRKMVLLQQDSNYLESLRKELFTLCDALNVSDIEAMENISDCDSRNE